MATGGGGRSAAAEQCPKTQRGTGRNTETRENTEEKKDTANMTRRNIWGQKKNNSHRSSEIEERKPRQRELMKNR